MTPKSRRHLPYDFDLPNYSLSVKTTSRWEKVWEASFQTPAQVTRLRCASPSFEPNTSEASAFGSYLLLSRTTKVVITPLSSSTYNLSPLRNLYNLSNTANFPFLYP